MTLSELAVKISIQGAEQVRRSVLSVAGAMKDAAKSAGDLAQRAKPVAEFFINTGKAAASAALSVVGVQSAIFGLAAVTGFETAKNLDSLTRGLASVSRNAEDLRGQLGRLREVAKLPGLGFSEAVQGSLALQSAGLSAETAERSLKAFGNALASVGKGKAELDGVTLALQQIASKGKISAEEIGQLNERVPQIRAAMQAAFGTADTEALGKMGVDAQTFISGVVTELEKLPKVAGGVANSIENLQDRLQQALLPLGKGLVAMFEGAAPSIEKLFGKIEDRLTAIGEVLAAVGKSGVLAETLEKVLGLAGEFSKGDFQEGIARTISAVLTGIGNLPAAIDQARTYITDLFSVLGNNADKIGIYIGGRFEDIFSKISATIQITTDAVSEAIDRMVKVAGGALQVIMPVATGLLRIIAPALAAVFDSVAPGIAKMAKGIGLDSLLKVIPSGDIIKSVWENTQLKFPTLDGLPAVPDLMKTLGQGGDQNLAKILGSVTGLSDLPDGLNYGGGNNGKDAPGQRTAVEASLQNIEWNTKATADALSLRRQVTGGGDLGQVGVTPAELLGGNPSGRSGMALGGSTGDLYAQAMELLRRAAEQTARQQMARASGSSMAFKPR